MKLTLYSLFLIFAPLTATVFGQETDRVFPTEHVRFFENNIRPILAEHCLKCHGPEKQEGGLRLDSRAAILVGGDSGPAIVIDQLDECLLLGAVNYEDYEMPPKGPLDDDQIDILAKWIQLGAPWSNSADAAFIRMATHSGFTAKDRQWWAIQPVIKPELPATKNPEWARNEIDQFILAAMETHHLTPSETADRVTLIRRLYFDLIGLPPTPNDIDAFVADTTPDAYAQLVDQLLDDPRYGQRWARHWLDLVRYADSDGYKADHVRPNAWRYRDYVIQSLNDDKPYDRFMQEQLAGDELFPDDPDALIATGFLRHGIYEYNSRDAAGQLDIMLNELTDTTGDVFLGLGLQCARCHDHKFDPILQKDYFRLRAFLEPIQFINKTAATLDEHQQHAAALKDWESNTEKIRDQINRLEEPHYAKAEKRGVVRFPAEIKAMYHKPDAERTPRENQIVRFIKRQVEFESTNITRRLNSKEKEKVLALRRDLAKFKKPNPLPLARVANDVGQIPPATTIPKRDTVIEPGMLSILDESAMMIEPLDARLNSTGRRAALARWLSEPNNPLSTRVIVNRLWQYHFGRGLAPNSSDLGLLGGPPSHPELLDWLTVRFVEHGWRWKDLHRLILNSATYRQSTKHSNLAENLRIDPTNEWYWRAETRRLDAEQVRDSILAASGQLKFKSGGPGGRPDEGYRSIFTQVKRNSRDPLLEVFDLPLFFSSTPSRNTTTTPIQSLLLINSQTMLRHAAKLAGRASDESPSKSETIRRLWRLTLGRDATEEEVAISLGFLDEHTEIIRQEIRDSSQSEIVSSGLKTGTFPYRTGQAIVFDPKQSMPLMIPDDDRLDIEEFTIEAFFQLGSVYSSGAVRTIVAKWNGKNSMPGWALGVTGKGSRRKPQTIVIQIYGTQGKKRIAEAAIFSDQHVELNTPYYVAASVRMADGEPGKVTFYLKDLSNDDDPISVATMEHQVSAAIKNNLPISIGRRNATSGLFDGLIDDIRLSKGILKEAELMIFNESVLEKTVGYWKFDPRPGVFRGSSTNHFKIQTANSMNEPAAPATTALIDLCHILLNSNEFLYVH